MKPSKRIRLALALLLLVLSVSLLLWGLVPGKRETRRQYIEPTQMQLPTPEAFQPARGFKS